MKIIEGLKKIKDLERKANDIVIKIKNHSAISNFQTPEYGNQKNKISEWLQSHYDTVKEIARLRVAIQKTNLETMVTIELDNKNITKSIAEWIHWRRDLSLMLKNSYSVLTDRGIKEGMATSPSGDPVEIKVIRFYNPEERDNKIELYTSEPMAIDSRLEIVNAITDLIE